MAKPPAILLLGPTPPPMHGVAAMTQYLLESGFARQCQVYHVETSDRRGIEHVDQPDWYDAWVFLRQWVGVMWCLLRRRPALCYLPLCQSPIGFFRDSLFLLPVACVGTRVVAHLHGGHFRRVWEGRSALWRGYVGFILRRVTSAIVLGESLRDQFVPWIAPSSVRVVPNGIPPMLPPDCVAMRDTIEPRRIRILWVSTLCEQKGLFVLLHALALLIRRCPDVECMIAEPWGGAGTAERADQSLRDLALHSVVRFVGPVAGEAKTACFQSSDIFVFPGVQQEGQPISVLEAMSAGLPTVATDRGCLRETLEDGVTGYIVPPNDPQALADKLALLIDDHALRRRMGRAAYERFHISYTLPRFLRDMERVVLETVTGYSPEAPASPRLDQESESIRPKVGRVVSQPERR